MVSKATYSLEEYRAMLKRKTRHLDDKEHRMQKSFFQVIRLLSGKNPELDFMYAVPNAAKRSPRIAAIMKAEGLKSGVLDTFLPIPANGYHGCYIEFKTSENELTEKQERFKAFVEKMGYMVFVCRTAEDGIISLGTYLGRRLIV